MGRVVIYDTALDAYVDQYALRVGKDVAEQVMAIAIEEAPEDTGELKLRHEVVFHDGIYWIFVDTGYAMYVHEGTGEYHPDGRKGGWVYWHEGKKRFYFTVGQRANRWLSRAGDAFENGARVEGAVS